MRMTLAALLALATALLQAQAPARRFTLPDGLRVALREDPARALFRLRLRVELRPGDIPPGQEGLLQLTLRMMDHGQAGHLGPTAFDRLLDEGGIQLTRRLSARAITWELVCRNRDQDRALGLLADRILRPVLDPGILETERLACWQAETQALATPRGALDRALLPGAPPAPTELGLGRLSFANLETFLGRVLRPDRAVLALEGDLGLEQAKALVLLSFGTWTASPASAEAHPAAASPGAGSLPATLRLPGAAPRAEGAAPPPAGLSPALRDLARLWLAGNPPVASDELPPAPDGSLRFRADAPLGTLASAALATLQAQISQVLAAGIAPADLAQAKAAWAGTRQIRILHPEAQLDADVRDLLGEEAQPDAVAAVTPDQLQAALRQWLAPSNLRWVLVTP